MIRFATIARSAAAALALALTAAPLTALADEPAAGARDHRKGHEDRAAQFPMTAEAFGQLVERRIVKARGHLDRVLAGKPLPAPVLDAVRRDFELGAEKVRDAAKKAEKNGQVTKEEARVVREVAREVVSQGRAKYGLGKPDHAKGRRAQAHGKGHGKKG